MLSLTVVSNRPTPTKCTLFTMKIIQWLCIHSSLLWLWCWPSSSVSSLSFTASSNVYTSHCDIDINLCHVCKAIYFLFIFHIGHLLGYFLFYEISIQTKRKICVFVRRKHPFCTSDMKSHAFDYLIDKFYVEFGTNRFFWCKLKETFHYMKQNGRDVISQNVNELNAMTLLTFKSQC